MSLSKGLGALLLGALALLAGCSKQYAISVAASTAAWVSLDDQYEEVIQTVAAMDLSDAERKDLQKLRTPIDRLHVQVDSILGEKADEQAILRAGIEIGQLQLTYELAKQAYTQAEAIIMPKLATADPATQFMLQQFRHDALLLDRNVQKLLAEAKRSGDATLALNEIIHMATLALRVGLAVL